MRSERLIASLLLVLALAFPAAAQEPWPEKLWNPHADEGDLRLPLPCGGEIVFRPVAIDAEENWLSDLRFELGGPERGLRLLRASASRLGGRLVQRGRQTRPKGLLSRQVRGDEGPVRGGHGREMPYREAAGLGAGRPALLVRRGLLHRAPIHLVAQERQGQASRRGQEPGLRAVADRVRMGVRRARRHGCQRIPSAASPCRRWRVGSATMLGSRHPNPAAAAFT